MKKKTLDIIVLKWILRIIKDNLNEALVWVLVVLVVYVFVKPNSILLSINSETHQDVPEQITEIKTFYRTYPKILVFIYHYQSKGRGKLLAIDTEKSLIEGEWNALAGNWEEAMESSSKGIPPNRRKYRVRATRGNQSLKSSLCKGFSDYRFLRRNPHFNRASISRFNLST